MDITKIIETLPKYTQVICNDCTMLLLKDENLLNPMRKELVTSMIQLVRTQLNNIEQHITEIYSAPPAA